MNTEFMKLRSNCRRIIVDIVGGDTYSETYNPSINYDDFRESFPLEELDRYWQRERGFGVKTHDSIYLWATGKPLPAKPGRKSKRIKFFGREYLITITWKSI